MTVVAGERQKRPNIGLSVGLFGAMQTAQRKGRPSPNFVRVYAEQSSWCRLLSGVETEPDNYYLHTHSQ